MLHKSNHDHCMKSFGLADFDQRKSKPPWTDMFFNRMSDGVSCDETKAPHSSYQVDNSFVFARKGPMLSANP